MAIAVALLIALLLITGTDYETYFEGAQFVHFLLGPATVALAVPLYANLARVRKAALPMAVALSRRPHRDRLRHRHRLGARRDSATVLVSLAPKSVTTPIAMAVSEQHWRPRRPHRGAGDPDRHPRRDDGDAADECAAHPRLRRPRLRRRGLPPTASAPPAPSRSTRSPAPSPASPWGLNAVVTPALIPALLPG